MASQKQCDDYPLVNVFKTGYRLLPATPTPLPKSDWPEPGNWEDEGAGQEKDLSHSEQSLGPHWLVLVRGIRRIPARGCLSQGRRR